MSSISSKTMKNGVRNVSEGGKGNFAKWEGGKRTQFKTPHQVHGNVPGKAKQKKKRNSKRPTNTHTTHENERESSQMERKDAGSFIPTKGEEELAKIGEDVMNLTQPSNTDGVEKRRTDEEEEHRKSDHDMAVRDESGNASGPKTPGNHIA